MLAVTTRNTLRSARYCAPMLRARRAVHAQLAGTPGLVRYVDMLASPTEFVTMTVWESHAAMFAFMSSGAHERVMWLFSRWSSSFWSMRWLPTGVERGAWEGLALASSATHASDRLPCGPETTLANPLGALPGFAGASSQPPLGRRVIDPRGSGVCAITALVEMSTPPVLWSLLRTIRTLRGPQRDARLLRWCAGLVGPRSAYLLTLWRDCPEALSGTVEALRGRLGASWTMCWSAGDYEIGNWDGFRLRQLAAVRERRQRVEQTAPVLPSEAAGWLTAEGEARSEGA